MQDVAKWPKHFLENMHLASMKQQVQEHHISQINPLVVQIMKDVGIDITNRKPKEMIEDMIRNATKIVNMGCMDKDFPTLFVHNVVDWGIEDQKGKPIEKMKEMRDEIERRVKKVVEEMKREEME
jgi:arsenate reductase (thioredoxin)